MKIKTADLQGRALDWAVAKCESDELVASAILHQVTQLQEVSPSTNWALGGPIIDRIKGFELKQWLESSSETCCEAHIHNYDGDWIQFGPTPLIAAMRCYVACSYGDEFDIPDELASSIGLSEEPKPRRPRH